MQHVSEFRVRYAETDQMGVVYHANYLVWCEVGRTDFIRALGVSYAELEQQGTALAVAEARIRFKRSARYDDVVQVFTTVASVRSRVVTFDYSVRAASGTELAAVSTVLVAIGRAGTSTQIPEGLRTALEAAIER